MIFTREAIGSTDEHWSAPELAEIEVSDKFLQTLFRAVNNLKSIGADYATWLYGCNVTFYIEVDGPEALSLSPLDPGTILLPDGRAFHEAEPEVDLDGAGIKLWASGSVEVVVPFKHMEGEFWMELGNIIEGIKP
jgi:hypothetical protein